MLTLFEKIKPYIKHSLKVSYGHTLHVEEYGNPKGIPVLFVHGGPGAGCESYHARFFDPELYHIVLFDQRGCGKSRPHASIEHNTTDLLVEDIEAIRNLLKIDAWVLFGGSWGSTLSLVYAQQHPDRVLALILRGIFLCRDEDINWFYQQGCSAIFPDYWQDFIKPIAPDKRNNLLQAYYEELISDNEIKRMAAAKAWSLWEGRTANLIPDEQVQKAFAAPHFALAMARIEAHYFINHAFIKDKPILENMNKIRHLPGVIVHGRYDVICPLQQAYALKQAWPGAQLKVIADAGHSAFERGTIDALVRASNIIAGKLS